MKHSEETRKKLKDWWTPERKEEQRKKLKMNNPMSNPQHRKKQKNGAIKSYEKRDKIIMENLPFEKWSPRLIIKTLHLDHKNICEKCGYTYTDPETKKGPFQIHHIDGNNDNWKRENLEYLCLNCHWKTPNFGFRNRLHSDNSKKIFSENIKKLNSKNKHIYTEKYLKACASVV